MKSDSLHIYWKLLNSCPGACTYCPGPRTDDRVVIMADRLLKMAWRILQVPACAYDITIKGGEPALHGNLPRLVSYLSSAGRG